MVDRDRDDVLAISASLRDAVRSKDAPVALSFMTDDVVFVGLFGPPVVGRAAVRDALFSPVRWKHDVDETTGKISVEIIGDIAVVMRESSAVATLTVGRSALPSLIMTGRTITVFRRQVDGWKLARWMNLMQKVRKSETGITPS